MNETLIINEAYKLKLKLYLHQVQANAEGKTQNISSQIVSFLAISIQPVAAHFISYIQHSALCCDIQIKTAQTEAPYATILLAATCSRTLHSKMHMHNFLQK